MKEFQFSFFVRAEAHFFVQPPLLAERRFKLLMELSAEGTVAEAPARTREDAGGRERTEAVLCSGRNYLLQFQ